MPKVIMLNAPPRLGKDFIARRVMKTIAGTGRAGFADAIKRETHAKFGRPDLPFDHFELLKDTPVRLFGNATPRQAYISHANETRHLKGQEYYGRLLVETIEASNFRLVIVPDAGKPEETNYLAEKIGHHNISLIQLHDGRTDFSACNRKYLTLDNITTSTIHGRRDDQFLSFVLNAATAAISKAAPLTEVLPPVTGEMTSMPAWN